MYHFAIKFCKKYTLRTKKLFVWKFLSQENKYNIYLPRPRAKKINDT